VAQRRSSRRQLCQGHLWPGAAVLGGVGAYRQEVTRRLLAKSGVPTKPQLDNWLTYRFLV
jgi:hypothetical protein